VPSLGHNHGGTDGMWHIALVLQTDVAAQEDTITSRCLGSSASEVGDVK
jgi:hypothetical protein